MTQEHSKSSPDDLDEGREYIILPDGTRLKCGSDDEPKEDQESDDVEFKGD